MIAIQGSHLDADQSVGCHPPSVSHMWFRAGGSASATMRKLGAIRTSLWRSDSCCGVHCSSEHSASNRSHRSSRVPSNRVQSLSSVNERIAASVAGGRRSTPSSTARPPAAAAATRGVVFQRVLPFESVERCCSRSDTQGPNALCEYGRFDCNQIHVRAILRGLTRKYRTSRRHVLERMNREHLVIEQLSEPQHQRGFAASLGTHDAHIPVCKTG